MMDLYFCNKKILKKKKKKKNLKPYHSMQLCVCVCVCVCVYRQDYRCYFFDEC